MTTSRGTSSLKSCVSLMKEGIYANEHEDMLRGVTVFNVPIGDPEYVEAMLRNKAHEVAGLARDSMDDLRRNTRKSSRPCCNICCNKRSPSG